MPNAHDHHHAHAHGHASHQHEDKSPPTKTKDPVCGMDVDPKSAVGTSTHDGTTYFFCSTSCRKKFDGDPSSLSSSGNFVLAWSRQDTSA